MAAPKLVDSDVASGRRVAEVLWKDPILNPVALLWIFDTEIEEWLFLIGTFDARHRGPKATYLRIRSLLKAKGLLTEVPLTRVIAIDDRHPIISALFVLASTSGTQLADISISGPLMLNGQVITGAHVYHLCHQPLPFISRPAQS